MTLELGAAEIRDGVRRTFNRVAETPGAKFRFAVGPALARDVGYPAALIAELPPLASESFTGLAYLHPHLALVPGERVLDLGSGTGLDAVIASRVVRPGGAVRGLDIAEAMVGKARRVAAAAGAESVEVMCGDAEAMPFADASFDAALVNGFFNLCPDKLRVAYELARVLRPGGRAAVAEITYTRPLPPSDVRELDDWFR